MIKEAINRILELAAPQIFDIGGIDYSSKPLNRIIPPTVDTMVVHTISAISDYIHSAPDAALISDNYLIHIADYNSVFLYDSLRSDMERTAILEAKLNDVSPRFGQWYDLESFNIMMQSSFVPNDDSAKILRMVGNVADSNLKSASDNGVTQQVTVKTGISLVGNEVVPNPVRLIPFRTFADAVQPESMFVLRLKKQGESITAALFEADGGAWKNEAIANIKTYLEENIPEERKASISILA